MNSTTTYNTLFFIFFSIGEVVKDLFMFICNSKWENFSFLIWKLPFPFFYGWNYET